MKCEGLRGARVGCAMTGSFCTFDRAFLAWRGLREAGAELYPIMSGSAAGTDTRFFAAAKAREMFAEICGRSVWTEIREVEPIGPGKLLDAVVVAPCTGNTLAKLALGITDTSVTMAAKSHLRNAGPLIVAVSTNDGLSRSARNIGALMEMKHVYLVPFRQDDCVQKPDSLVAAFELVKDTVALALLGKQIQPLLLADKPKPEPGFDGI